MAVVGVVVGRFQVPYLSEAHRKLLDIASERSNRLIVFIGDNNHLKGTWRNPLPWRSREWMVQEYLLSIRPQKDFYTHRIIDGSNNDEWSQRLDSDIDMYWGDGDSVLLFGGRDSFLEAYNGRHSLSKYLVPEIPGAYSGSEIRSAGSEQYHSEDFRRGMIFAHQITHPSVYPTVDIAIFNPSYTKILLIRKPGHTKWQLCGGFADPESDTYEDDCVREAREECGVLVQGFHYLGSRKIDDWRYRGERDCIKTMLFSAFTEDKLAVAGDDAEEVKWFNACFHIGDRNEPEFLADYIEPHHQELVKKACAFGYAMSLNPPLY